MGANGKNPMSIDFYMLPASSPCRAVTLTAAALGIADKLQEHRVNLMNGEHLTPEYLKINPQHTIPTIVDDGFSLWESRAIIRYLVNKYGGADSPLYPAEPRARALVDQRLDFDMGTLYAKFAAHFYPQFFGGKPEEGSLQKLQDALGFLNTFLESGRFAAGDQLTIADLALVATVSTIEATGVSLDEYPNIVRWYGLIKSTAPDYEKANAEPVAEFKALVESKMASK